MTLTLSLLAGCTVLELLIYSRLAWQHAHRVLAAALIIMLAALSGLAITQGLGILAIIVLTFTVYRIFNLLRVVRRRMHDTYLHHVTWRTGWWLNTAQWVLIASWLAVNQLSLSATGWWLVLAGVHLLASGYLLIVVYRSIKRLRYLPAEAHCADRDLPSISVCIPARNETAEMEACLRSLLASDYPKLEILVLDDQSHDRTPEIIRGFAHDGVRFISGNTAPANWLAKNWAYQRLYEEATGEWLVFAGVDVRLDSGMLRTVISALQTDTLRMLSIMPRNTNTLFGVRRSVLLQPIRYAWELCLAPPFSRRPPVLSTCWLVQRQLVRQAGGFAAVSRSITPESHFAKTAGDGYRFVQASSQLPVTSHKDFRSQWNTAIRTRYPQLHRRPELTALVTAALCMLTLLPYVALIDSILSGHAVLIVFSAVGIINLTIAYSLIVRLTYGAFLWRSLISLPLAISLDIILRHYSMVRYEFGEVVWKGRDVIKPVMHVYPHLPKAD